MTDRDRLLLAGKTAYAAALAWWLAPLIPFTSDEYTYYAPLGVLVSMYPTVAASAKSGAQTFVGLLIGVALGLAGLLAHLHGVPAVVVLAGVIGAGVLLGGVRALGPGRTWASTTAVFVLLLSGREPDEYSISFLGTMAFGVLVGVAVNLLIFPPLYLRRASDRLSALRDVVKQVLDQIANFVDNGNTETDSLDTDQFRSMLDNLDVLAAQVRADVAEAAESSRANPLRKRHRGDADQNDRRITALSRVAFYTKEIATVLAPPDRTQASSMAPGVNHHFAEAIRACSVLVATPPGAADSIRNLDEAKTALHLYVTSLQQATEANLTDDTDELIPAVCLQRLIDTSRPFVTDREE